MTILLPSGASGSGKNPPARAGEGEGPPFNCGLVYIRRLSYELQAPNRTAFFPATIGAELEEILLAIRLCCGIRVSLEPNQSCTEACRPQFCRPRIPRCRGK